MKKNELYLIMQKLVTTAFSMTSNEADVVLNNTGNQLTIKLSGNGMTMQMLFVLAIIEIARNNDVDFEVITDDLIKRLKKTRESALAMGSLSGLEEAMSDEELMKEVKEEVTKVKSKAPTGKLS